jgi:hypothetical protein
MTTLSAFPKNMLVTSPSTLAEFQSSWISSRNLGSAANSCSSTCASAALVGGSIVVIAASSVATSVEPACWDRARSINDSINEQLTEELQVAFLAYEVFGSLVFTECGIQRVTGLVPTRQLRQCPKDDRVT